MSKHMQYWKCMKISLETEKWKYYTSHYHFSDSALNDAKSLSGCNEIERRTDFFISSTE